MKKYLLILLFLVLGGAIGYLFVYPYDYLVTIEAKANTGTINQTIKLWSSTLDNSELKSDEDLDRLRQTLYFNDSIHIYSWNISPVNDSVSKIKVFAKDSTNSFFNKIRVPFTKTDFEKRVIKTLNDFNTNLHSHTENIKVRVVGEDELEPTYYAYVTVKTAQTGKAAGMMRNFPLLNTFLANNGAKLNGHPFVEITDWNKKNDSIEYQFGYPVQKSDSLPSHPELKYGTRKPRKAIKAIYNGNYITSDRAWYALLDYAKKNKIAVTGLPIEVFYDNPNIGGNELNWKAEVYMPLAN